MRGLKDKSSTKNKFWRGKNASNYKSATESGFLHSLWGERCCLLDREILRMGFGPIEHLEVLQGEEEEEKC